jgi:hypothetical protein
MFLCFYGNVLVTSFTVILRPLDYGTATRGNPGFRLHQPRSSGTKNGCPPDWYIERSHLDSGVAGLTDMVLRNTYMSSYVWVIVDFIMFWIVGEELKLCSISLCKFLCCHYCFLVLTLKCFWHFVPRTLSLAPLKPEWKRRNSSELYL